MRIKNEMIRGLEGRVEKLEGEVEKKEREKVILANNAESERVNALNSASEEVQFLKDELKQEK